MEGTNKSPPSCLKSKRATDNRPFSMTASSKLPLTSGSFQRWKKPYFLIHAGSVASSSGTKPYYPRSDLKATLLPMVINHDNKKSRNPFPPSDKNPIPSGDNNSVKTEPETGANTRWCRNLDPNMDPKKLRRIISNRVSAQKSRMKKLQYVIDMEKKVKALEAQIAVLNPQVSLYRNHQEMLAMEQKRLNQRMVTYTNNSLLRDVEIEEKKAEVNRLRQLHLTQQQEKVQLQIRMPVWESAGMEELINPSINRSGQGQMVCMNSNQGQYGENTKERNGLKQLKSKQLAVQCGEDKAEGNGHDLLNMNVQLQQQNRGQLLIPGWELGQEQMPNQSESMQKENMNLNLGGIEQILSLNLSQN